MRFKLTPLLAGSLLMLGTVTAVMSTHLSAQAQMPVLATVLTELNLSEAQQQQLGDLRQTTRNQVQSVLTTEQQVYMQAIVLEGADFRESIAAMDITPEQRQEIRGIFQSAKGELQTILTPEQRTTLRQSVLTQWRQF